MTHYLYSDQVRTLLIFFTIVVVVGNFALLTIERVVAMTRSSVRAVINRAYQGRTGFQRRATKAA